MVAIGNGLTKLNIPNAKTRNDASKAGDSSNANTFKATVAKIFQQLQRLLVVLQETLFILVVTLVLVLSALYLVLVWLGMLENIMKNLLE